MTTIAAPAIISKRESYLFDGLYSYVIAEWDGEKITSRSISTGYDGPSAEWLDAKVTTDVEALAAAKLWQEEQYAEAARIRDVRLAEEEAVAIRKGKLVKVIAGRKVAIGTTGIVFWIEDGGYGKVGIALDDEKDSRGRAVNVAWTYLKNIEIVR